MITDLKKAQEIRTKQEPSFINRNAAKLIGFLISPVQFLTVSLMMSYTNWISVLYDDYILIASLILIYPLLWIGLDIGSSIDNSRFMKGFQKHEYVAFTHKASSEVLNQKINSGVLTPYPDKSSGFLGKTKLGREFVKKMDHPTKVTWGHYGRPEDSKDYKQGLIRLREKLKFWKKTKSYYDSAITIYVPIELIKFPKGTVKKIFGKHQLILEQEVQLKGTWVERYEMREVQENGKTIDNWVSLGIEQL
ncbi:hypothetical protein [Vibrio alginolyticus]|uniref:hypothetical protein n=1 Tax=Vibrio alginolyticus TaxID=663 RepID=UPI00215FC8B9|nr:hypothetical protein [Vibrio alginolyticus]MCS0160662.1 hypothetical protein [Vibrio alginolyticus]MCS0211217.1 hypothetical protein [Vibrio alginolyticus]